MLRALRKPRIVAFVLAAGVLAVGAIAFTAWYEADVARQKQANGQACLSAATAAAQAIFSYDYRSFDASVANGTTYTSGEFGDQYRQTTASLKETAVQQQAVVRAEVSAAGIISSDVERVELLLYVNQYRRNVAIDGEKVDQNRVVLTMVPGEGGCKIIDATAI